MTRLKTLLTLAAGAAALSLTVPAAQAQVPTGVYKSKVGDYSILPVPDDGLCGVIRKWEHPDYGEIQLMMLDYADEEFRVMSLTRGVAPEGLEEGRVQLELIFLDNGDVQVDRSWGVRLFGYQNRDGKAFMVSQFDGEDEMAITEDLTNSRALGLYNGEELLLAVPLDGIGEAMDEMSKCTATL